MTDEKIKKSRRRKVSKFEAAVSDYLDQRENKGTLKIEEDQNITPAQEEFINKFERQIINTFTELKICAEYNKVKFFNRNSVKDFEEFILNNAVKKR